MSTYLDKVISAVVDSIKKSGLLESGTVQGVVSAVGSDGTVTVARNTDTYPKVRMVGPSSKVAVGDSVVIHRTLGGWVCLGVIQDSVADTGWVNMSLASGVTAYTGAATEGEPPPQVRRVGNVVYLRGRWSFTTAPSAGVRTAICTVPAGFRPTGALDLVCAATAAAGAYTAKAFIDINNVNGSGAYVVSYWCGAASSWGGFSPAAWTTD